MRPKRGVLLLFTLSVLFSCNTTKKEEGTVSANQAETAQEKRTTTVRYQIDTGKSTTTYIGSKPTGKHHGKVAISEGYFEFEKHQITGGKVVLDMNSITVNDLASEEEAHGRSVLIDHLKSDDFLDVYNHPTGTFRITGVTAYTKKEASATKKEFESPYQPLSKAQHIIDNPTHQMTGNLTLRGITKKHFFPSKHTKVQF